MTTNKAKQRVKIRTRSTSDTMESLLLDWVKDNKRKREFLNLQIFKNPKGVLEKQHNKDTLYKAELLRAERERQFFTDEIDIIAEQKKLKTADFINYFEEYVKNYTKKDLRVMKALLNQYRAFAPPHITAKEVTEKHCTDFKAYLEDNLSGETPSSYFSRFKKVIRQATKDKLFRTNPTTDIRNEKGKSNPKDILTIEELTALSNTRCGNEEVRRAFLFACNTGLRWVDIVALKWENVKQDSVKFVQSKTNEPLEVTLNDNAKKFLANRQEPQKKVFTLPSHNATLDNLQRWAKNANVEKHITFHCARHTFGTLLAYYDTQQKAIADLMGHTNTRYTDRYVRIAQKLKEEAVNKIPNF